MNTPLDPLADFRPDGYGLDDERRARLRSRVLDAIPDDAPAGVSTLVTARPSTATRRATTTTTATTPRSACSSRCPPAADGRPAGTGITVGEPNGRRLLVAAAVAVALGLLAVVVGTSRSTDRQVGHRRRVDPRGDPRASSPAVAARPARPGARHRRVPERE